MGGLPSPAYSQAATCAKCSSSRRASPSGVWYSRRKCPPQDSLRSRASRHISSASSRKSATRPAFSSDWLIEASSPSTRTLRQYSSRRAGIFSSAVLRPSAERAIPPYSPITLPTPPSNPPVLPHHLSGLGGERGHRALPVDG